MKDLHTVVPKAFLICAPFIGKECSEESPKELTLKLRN